MLNRGQRPVTILIINNNGGDIFSLLPSALMLPSLMNSLKWPIEERTPPWY